MILKRPHTVPHASAVEKMKGEPMITPYKSLEVVLKSLNNLITYYKQKISLLGARTLPVAPGLTTRNKKLLMSRNT